MNITKIQFALIKLEYTIKPENINGFSIRATIIFKKWM